MTTKNSKELTKILAAESHFVLFFGGKESNECVRLREELFNQTWSNIDSRVQVGAALSHNLNLSPGDLNEAIWYSV